MITVHGGLEEISAGWDALAQECGAPPFERPGWFRLWSAAFGSGTLGGREQVERRNRRGAPLVRSRNGLRSATNEHTPRFGLLAKDERGPRARRLGLRAAPPQRHPRVRRSRSLRIQRLEAAAASRGYRVLTTTYERSPFLVIDGTWEDYERGLSGRVRRDLDRRLRRLEEMGPVRLDVSDGTSGRAELLAEGFGSSRRAGRLRAGQP